jgi:hypothetical protein
LFSLQIKKNEKGEMKNFQNSYGAAMVQTVADQSAATRPKREEPAQSSKLDALG